MKKLFVLKIKQGDQRYCITYFSSNFKYCEILLSDFEVDVCV